MSNVWSPLTTHWAVNLVDSAPRNAPITGIQNHHTASPNKAVCLALFAPGGRTVTPNYFVAGREIWGIVPENRRAYTSGSPYDDHRALTIETLNSTAGPFWRIDSVTLDTLARLNADIARRRKVSLRHAVDGIYEHRNIYTWFGRSYATACAGPSFNINTHIAATRRHYAPNPAPKPPIPILTSEEDELKPTIHYRTTGKGEWCLAHPEIGSDLAPGKSRKTGHVTVFRGYQVTADKATGVAWARTYAKGSGGETSRVNRAGYVAIQAAAQQVALELTR